MRPPLKFPVSLSALAGALLLAASPSHALDRVPVLSLEVARKMVAACDGLAREKGWRMQIAVVDAGAHLIAFERMDRAFLGSGDIALQKAKFAANFPFSTRFAGELTFGKDGKGGPVPGLASIPGVVTFAGGLPIMAGGAHVGGIGVSGASADEDEVCAKAAIDAVKDSLN